MYLPILCLKGMVVVKKVILLILLLSLFSVAAFAHSGGTDSSGGHYDHKNGGYHYHHGYSAHQHPGGVCPYDSSSKSSGSSNYVPLIYPDDGEGLLTTANVNMRSGAGTDYGIVTTLSSGTKLTYEGKTSGNWHYVRYGLNTYGWVHNSYLKIDSSRPAPTAVPKSSSTPKPYRSETKARTVTMLTFENGFWIFASGFAAGMILLAIYAYKAHQREDQLKIESNREYQIAYNAGASWGKSQVHALEQKLLEQAKDLESRESQLIETTKLYKADLINLEANLYRKISDIQMELLPDDAHTPVLISCDPYNRSLYHSLNSTCIVYGKKVTLLTAQELGLRPCTRCKPLNSCISSQVKTIENYCKMNLKFPHAPEEKHSPRGLPPG